MINKHHPGFGSAAGGSRHDPPAVAGVWRDAHGPARTLRSRRRDRQFAALHSAMWQDRRRVLIDRLGWDLQSPDGCHELDQYDGDDTLYLIVWQAETGRHLGSVRLLPSTGSHMLRDIFPHLCANGVPLGPEVWEITRLVTAPGLSRTEALQVRRQLSVALFEHALAAGIARYTMVTHLPWLPSLLGVGWDAEPLGLPHGEGANAIAALQIMVDAGTLIRLRGAWQLPDAVLPRLAN